MIICLTSANRRQYSIDSGQNLRSKAPARAKQNQTMFAINQPLSKSVIAQHVCMASSARRQGQWSSEALPGIIGIQVIQVGTNLNDGKGLFPIIVVSCPIALPPMVDDLTDQVLLVGKGGDDIKVIYPIGLAGSGNIVDVKIGDRRADNFLIFIANRVMNKGKVKFQW